ncbi:chemotaxis response regulator protein-glutamate methylesterase [Halobacteriovorax sp. GB3]|uniref:protein-glutamate methylesterase/protein-glutamine glutaminase n=1 Tax=Halobacteriovorax sp. GB3 TaxID=2719615 RepID=UPI0023627B83|nr:chemotaxis response regulator protein-glutamate methylesterase [Halobacteriovorax sp. GB3]MDD0853783.1 chemotaxis response regulator protein-glutamate methylesterase [Halobacteriovorax sp. GB3]
MKTNSFISSELGKDFYLRIKDMLFVSIHGSKDACAIIFKDGEVTAINIEAFIEKAKSIKFSSATAKLIGPRTLIMRMKTHLSRLGFKDFREVERRGEFEIVFTPNSGALRVSKATESANVSSNAAREIKKQGDVKVLVVDDSKTIRNLLSRILNQAPGVNVVATAEKPSDVEELIKKHNPDVITLDIHMPEMTGVELLKKIHPKFKIPTIMVTSISIEEGPLVLEALENGAFDYIQKPKMEELAEVAPILIEKVREASKYVESSSRSSQTKSVGQFNQESLVVIGSSTGGTNALKDILTKMPSQIPPMLIVQHIPPVFSKAFADRLNTLCPFTVKEAEDGEVIEQNKVLVAPGGKQMKVEKRGGKLHVVITDDAPVNRFKPSVDYLFNSTLEISKRRHVVGVILTGMGKDGAEGLLKLRKNGAYTIAQDEESCVVYGMPREAAQIGAAMCIEHKDDIAAKIGELSFPDSQDSKKEAS